MHWSVARALGVLAIATATLRCAPVTSGPGADTPKRPKVEAAKVTGPQGSDLVSACTPTGPELCFNATDDNCNGVLEEGCGVPTGIVQFMVAWGEAGADIDLAVTTPGGERINDNNRATPSGFHLERDCPGEGCHGQNYENIYFEGWDPPRGKYTVDVKLSDPHGASLPLRARVGARVGAQVYGADVTFTQADEKQSLVFDLASGS